MAIGDVLNLENRLMLKQLHENTYRLDNDMGQSVLLTREDIVALYKFILLDLVTIEEYAGNGTLG